MAADRWRRRVVRWLRVGRNMVLPAIGLALLQSIAVAANGNSGRSQPAGPATAVQTPEPIPIVVKAANETPQLLERMQRRREAVDPVAWAIQMATGVPITQTQVMPGVFARAEARAYDDFTIVWRLAPGVDASAVKLFHAEDATGLRVSAARIGGSGGRAVREWSVPNDAGVSSLRTGVIADRDASGWAELRATIVVPFTNYSVTNTNDSGAGSLRQALINANADGNNPHVISISATGTINLMGALPQIDDISVSINGPGAENLTVNRLAGGNYSVFETPSILYSRTYGFSGMRIQNGSADLLGGGVRITGGTLTLNQMVLANNLSGSGGGGLSVGSTTVTISNSTFTGNSTGLQGSAINAQGAILTISNSTFSGNQVSSGGQGGAIYHFVNATTMTLTNCTFAGNTNPGGGGKALVAANLANVRNTVFSGASPQISGNVSSLGNNLSSDGSGNLSAAGDLPNTNALLSVLGSYGGPTTTHALLPGSPAINAGSSTGAPASDQRGISRVSVVDIGAFESRGFTLTSTSGNAQTTNINAAFAAPLVATVSSSVAEPVQGGVVSFTAPGSGTSASLGTASATIAANGEASTSATANGTAGSYSVVANASGNSGAALSYALTNVALPSLSINDVAISEGNTGTQTLNFTVTRTGTTASAVSFQFASADDTATLGNNDYVLASGSTSIPAGGASASTIISVTINGDAVFETTETFFLNLSVPSNAVISDGQGIATINNDDSAPTLAISDASLIEGNGGTSSIVFIVTRTGLTALPASFSAVATNGTATAPSDYLTALSGTTSIAAGGATATTTLAATINGDLMVEADETFTVTLSGASNATLADGSATGTILNDDVAGLLITQSSGSTTVTEGGATDSYTVVLTSQPSANVVIALTATQVTATPTPLTFTSANWNVAQTVTVTAIDDAIVEGNHSGSVTSVVTSADASYNGVAVTPVSVTITDNDSATLSISDASLTEGNAGTASMVFTVTLSSAVSGGFSVPYSTVDGTAQAGSDYVAASAALSFAGSAGETRTVSVVVNGDSIVEANETFTVQLGTPSQAQVSLADGQGAGTIGNDDSASLSVAPVVQAEGDSGSSSFSFTLQLSGQVQGGFTVRAVTRDDSATAGSDYSAADVNVSFDGSLNPSRSVIVGVLGDTQPEALERFWLDLSSSQPSLVFNPASVAASIVNDDLSADLSVSNQRLSATGSELEYEVTVRNLSNVVDVPTAQFSYAVSAQLTGVQWTCTPGAGASCPASGNGVPVHSVSLSAGSSVVYRIQGELALGTPANEVVQTTATISVSSPYSDPVPANNTATNVLLTGAAVLLRDGFEDP